MKTVTRKININKLLEAHFAEDRANFAKADFRSDRTEKLLAQMGEHLSHMRKDVNILTDTQLKHHEDSKIFRENIMTTIDRIDRQTAPIIAEDARLKTVAESDKKRVETVKYFAGLVTSISVLSAAGWWVISKVIQNIR